MRPVWRLLLAVLEAQERGTLAPLTATERDYLAWLRAWRRREREEAR